MPSIWSLLPAPSPVVPRAESDRPDGSSQSSSSRSNPPICPAHASSDWRSGRGSPLSVTVATACPATPSYRSCQPSAGQLCRGDLKEETNENLFHYVFHAGLYTADRKILKGGLSPKQLHLYFTNINKDRHPEYYRWSVYCAHIGLNTLRPGQNGRHFADEVFKRIFLNENVWISLKISLKFVPKVPINNIPAFVQIMAWRRPGDKPLSEPMMVRLPTHICVTRPQWVYSLWPSDPIWKHKPGSTLARVMAMITCTDADQCISQPPACPPYRRVDLQIGG